MKRLGVAAIMLAVVGASFANFAFSQSAAPATAPAKPAATKPPTSTAAAPAATPAPYHPGANAAMDAEREKVWDSPQMLRARAWVKDYCAHSAKITPAEAKEYEAELANLSPKQMKLWLLKFQHEEEMIQQQQQMFNNARQADVGQAMALHKQMKQSYADINKDETEAAQTEEGSIKQQQQFAQERSMQKTADQDAAATDMLTQPFGGYGGYGGYGYGGVHFHFH
ncbi:hypothetical protein [Lacipirellula limnantheis]|uniref:LTXXQ motif protein n=1 Tax=Lacipirellula limnantheis TaxID=2528024 RepID=A0A517U2R3_9BACT|nr:hypothetical protein [Lacipirellula limnantheis]QDT74907.1 hypothetical protein I41_41110 [Lacipirellula limnantheis]